VVNPLTSTVDAFWGPSYWSTYTPFPNTSASDITPSLTIDTHQYYAFPPYANLSRPAILAHVCEISRLLKNSSASQHPIIVGEFSLETNSSPDSEDTERRAHSGPSQAQRTWYRLLFEAQAVAYSSSFSDNDDDKPVLGWYFWTWKTEWDIDTWSYRRGQRDGWIPSDVSNRSTFAFPVLGNGCVDSDFDWDAPAKVGAAARSEVPCWRWWLAVLSACVMVGVKVV
jgi:glucan 1,3-beta-glucosidase